MTSAQEPWTRGRAALVVAAAALCFATSGPLARAASMQGRRSAWVADVKNLPAPTPFVAHGESLNARRVRTART